MVFLEKEIVRYWEMIWDFRGNFSFFIVLYRVEIDIGREYYS